MHVSVMDVRRKAAGVTHVGTLEHFRHILRVSLVYVVCVVLFMFVVASCVFVVLMFIRSFVHPFIFSPVHIFTRSLVQSLIRSTRTFIQAIRGGKHQPHGQNSTFDSFPLAHTPGQQSFVRGQIFDPEHLLEVKYLTSNICSRSNI